MNLAEHIDMAEDQAIAIANGIRSRTLHLIDRTNLLNGDAVLIGGGHIVWYSTDHYVNVWCGPHVDPDHEHVVRIKARGTR